MKPQFAVSGMGGGASMNFHFRKEVRCILPYWLLALGTIIGFGMLPHSMGWRVWLLIPPSCAVLTILLGAASFGSEFQYRTMPLLLLQPLERAVLWRAKMMVLGMALLSLVVAVKLMLAYFYPMRLYPFSFLGSAICVFGMSPWLTLVARDGLIGAGLTFTVAGVHEIITKALLDPYPGYFFASEFVVSILLGVIGCHFGRQAFMRWEFAPPWRPRLVRLGAVVARRIVVMPAQARKGAHSDIPLTGIGRKDIPGITTPHPQSLSPLRGEGSHRCSFWRRLFAPHLVIVFHLLLRTVMRSDRREQTPLNSLVSKEFRLQTVSIAFVVVFCLGFAVIVPLVYFLPDREPLLKHFMQIYCAMFPVIAGAVSVAGERQLGFLEWHLSLPLSVVRQFLVKMGVCLTLGLGAGFLLPWALLRMCGPVPGWFPSPLIFLLVLIGTTVGVCSSSLQTGTLRAAITGLAGLLPVILGGAWLHNVFLHRGVYEWFYSGPAWLCNHFTAWGMMVLALVTLLRLALEGYRELTTAGRSLRVVAIMILAMGVLLVAGLLAAWRH